MLRRILKSNKRLHSDLTALGILTYFTFLISVMVIVGGLWLFFNSGYIPILHQLVIALGLILMVTSLVGFMGTCSRQTQLLRVYLFFLFCNIVAMLNVVVFAFAITNYRGDG